MNAVLELYARFRQLIREGAKFLVVGAIGFVVTLIGANALRSPVGEYWAITIATIVATIVTYLGNRYWTFTHREGKSTSRETISFLILNGIGLLIYYVCLWLKDLAGLDGKLWYNVAIVVGTGLGTLFRFWSYRKWIWTAPVIGPVAHEQLDPADLAVAPVPAEPGASSAVKPVAHESGRHRYK